MFPKLRPCYLILCFKHLFLHITISQWPRVSKSAMLIIDKVSQYMQQWRETKSLCSSFSKMMEGRVGYCKVVAPARRGGGGARCHMQNRTHQNKWKNGTKTESGNYQKRLFIIHSLCISSPFVMQQIIFFSFHFHLNQNMFRP
jgi:hypothetical protein